MFMLDGFSLNSEQTKREKVLALISSIKVLVVEKKDHFAYIANLLHSFPCEVTYTDHSGEALKLLTEKHEFDVLLIDSDMTEVDIHTFLILTKNMVLLSIVMSEEEDDGFALEAFKNGAFLVMKRPLTIDVVMHLRQHVIREKMHKLEKSKNNNFIPAEKAVTHEDNSSASISKDTGEPREHGGSISFQNNVAFPLSEDDDDNMKKKLCIEWTAELHDKFMNAVDQLGEGRCYPKEILELMGETGLTRMQVASHLQKCRNNRWKCKEKRRTPSSSRNNRPSSNISQQRVRERNFGYMPPIQREVNDNGDDNTPNDIELSINGRPTDVNYSQNQTSSGLLPVNTSSLDNFGVTDTGNGPNHHSFSSNQRQAADDFLDSLVYMDGNGSIENRNLNWRAPN